MNTTIATCPLLPDTPSQRRYFTAGDLARTARIDLKTVHNWANNGRVSCWRTAGRHLRFHPAEVIRILRRRGMPVPPDVALSSPRVVAVGLANEAPNVAAMRVDNVFDAVMEFGTQDHDVLVIQLDRIADMDVASLARSVRSFRYTGGRALVGVSADPRLRGAFVAAGADLCVGSSAEVLSALQWVMGTRAAGDSPA